MAAQADKASKVSVLFLVLLFVSCLCVCVCGGGVLLLFVLFCFSLKTDVCLWVYVCWGMGGGEEQIQLRHSHKLCFFDNTDTLLISFAFFVCLFACLFCFSNRKEESFVS